MSYRGVWALVFGRLSRGMAWAVPVAADPAAVQPVPCPALHIPTLETWALLWPGLVPSAELMAG